MRNYGRYLHIHRTECTESQLQISLVMALWWLDSFLLLLLSLSVVLSLFLPPSIDPPILPCMSWDVSGGCRVSIFRQRSGWLKSYMERSARHNMQEVHYDIFFPLFLKCLVSLCGIVFLGNRGQHNSWEGFRKIVATGLARWLLAQSSSCLMANTGGTFLRVLVFWSVRMPA